MLKKVTYCGQHVEHGEEKKGSYQLVHYEKSLILPVKGAVYLYPIAIAIDLIDSDPDAIISRPTNAPLY